MDIMDTNSLPRTVLIAAIEEGIQEAKLSGEAAERLRKVGAETKKVAIGTFWEGDCGCPLTQAHLFYDVKEDSDPDWDSYDHTQLLFDKNWDFLEIRSNPNGTDYSEVDDFYGAFDKYARQYTSIGHIFSVED